MTSGIVARVMVVAVVIGLMTVGAADACGNHGNPYCPTPTPKSTPTATSTPKVTATPKVTPTQPPGGFVPPPEDDPKPTPTRTPTAAPSATPTRTPIAVPTPVNGGPTPLQTAPTPRPTVPAVILPPKAGTGFLAIPSNGQIAPFVVIGMAALLVLGFMHGGARDE